MGMWNMKVTWLKGIASIVVLLELPWGLSIVDMIAGRSSLAIGRPLMRYTLVGYGGAIVAIASPVAAVFVGWLLLRRHKGNRRSLAVVFGTLGITIVLVYTGIYLITIGFPVGP